MSDQNTRMRRLLGFALLVASVAANPAAAQSDQSKAQANFAAADNSGDGQLDQAEFKTFMNLNAAQGLGRAPTIAKSGSYGRAFKTLDSNGDSLVSKTEVAAQTQ